MTSKIDKLSLKIGDFYLNLIFHLNIGNGIFHSKNIHLFSAAIKYHEDQSYDVIFSEDFRAPKFNLESLYVHPGVL